MAGRATKEVLEFEESDLTVLAAAVASVDSGGGWINLTPGIPTEIAPQDRSLISFFVGTSGPTAPMATWMPAEPGSTKPGVLGILHSRGRLHRQGIAGFASIPPSWRCKQDHARRGLLFEVGAVTPGQMAETMVAAVEELATVPTTGRYLAEVFHRPEA